MAQQIASLYAKIGADTSALKQGLQDANRQLGDTSKQMEAMGGVSANVDKKTASLGTSLMGMGKVLMGVTAGVAAFGIVAKKAFDFAAEGAVVTQTAQSFDRLGVSLQAMRAASLGTVDDMTLMSSTLTLTAGASEALQGKLLGAAPQLMEIAKAANALNPALGDTAFMYDSIATGVKRASPLILDNLGIMVKVGAANEAYAASVGKAVAELTAEEKQIALLNATLTAGSRLVEQAGGSAESATDSYAQLGAEAKNMGDSFKAAVHDGLEPAVDTLVRMVTAGQDALVVQQQLNAELAIDPDVGTWEEYVRVQIDAAKATGNYDMVTLALRGSMDAAGYSTTEAVKALRNQETVTAELIKLGSGFQDVMSKGAWQLDRYGAASNDAGVSMHEAYNAQKRLMKLIEDGGSKIGVTTKRWTQYNDAIAEASGAHAIALNKSLTERNDLMAQATPVAQRAARATMLVDAVNSTLGDTIDEQNSTRQDLLNQRADMLAQLHDLERANGTYVTGQREATLSGNELALAEIQLSKAREKMADAEVGSEAYAKAAVQVDKLTAKIGESGGAFTSMINNGKKISELEENIAGVTEQMQGLAGATREAVNASIFQSLVGKLDLSNLTEAQSALLETVAAATGIDTTFLHINERLNEAVEATDGIGESQEQAAAGAEKYGGIIDNMATNIARGWEDVGTSMGESFQRAALGEREIGVEAEAAMPKVASLADVAIPKMASVRDITGAAAARMVDLGEQAGNAQSVIDGMHGKDITVNIGFQVDNMPTIGHGTTQRGALLESEGIDGLADGGFAPIGTNYLVGEEGPELMSVGAMGTNITPLGGGGSRTGTTWTGDIIVQGAGSPDATANAVLRKLQDRGMIPSGGYR